MDGRSRTASTGNTSPRIDLVSSSLLSETSSTLERPNVSRLHFCLSVILAPCETDSFFASFCDCLRADMDSALTLPNLISLLFRGSPVLPSLLTQNTSEWNHLPKFRPLLALDLCGVNSRAFFKAVSDFVVTFLSPHAMLEGGEQEVKFEGMKRLGLHFCKMPSGDLEAFLGGFSGMTHLDLGYTRLTGLGLKVIMEWPLVSLSLSRTKVEGWELTE